MTAMSMKELFHCIAKMAEIGPLKSAGVKVSHQWIWNVTALQHWCPVISLTSLLENSRSSTCFQMSFSVLPKMYMYIDRHDDVMKWKHFPRYWSFVRRIHRGHRWILRTNDQWRGALIFSLINGWVNNREAGDLRRYRAHYDVTVMESKCCSPNLSVTGFSQLLKPMEFMTVISEPTELFGSECFGVMYRE